MVWSKQSLSDKTAEWHADLKTSIKHRMTLLWEKLRKNAHHTTKVRLNQRRTRKTIISGAEQKKPPAHSMQQRKVLRIANLYDACLWRSSLTTNSRKMHLKWRNAEREQRKYHANFYLERKVLHLFSNKSLAPLLWLWNLRRNAIMQHVHILIISCADGCSCLFILSSNSASL